MNQKYCVYGIENHPDRGISNIYGPFDNYEEASKKAESLNDDPSNYNAPYKHYFYTYRVNELHEN